MDTLQTRPKVRYVCDELERLAAELGPDAQLPTMVQLRDSLGVSMKTLHDSLRQMEKRNILRSVHGVGIFVENPTKRAVTGNIGFLVAAMQSSVQNLGYFGLVLAGLRQEASRNKQNVLLIDNATRFENWEKIDGLVVSELRDPRDGHYGLQAIPEGLPTVSILNQLPGLTNVIADDFRGTYLVTRHLIEQGHRRIAYLASQCEDIATIRHRRRGYLAALEEAGIELDPRWMRELRYRSVWAGQLDWFFPGGQAYMHEWLAEDWRELGCTALVAQNDETAFGAISSLRKAGYSVPNDISVTGFDGVPIVNDLLPSLTTVRVPLFEIGREAVRILTSEEANAQDVVLPVQLIQGSSSASPSS